MTDKARVLQDNVFESLFLANLEAAAYGNSDVIAQHIRADKRDDVSFTTYGDMIASELEALQRVADRLGVPCVLRDGNFEHTCYPSASESSVAPSFSAMSVNAVDRVATQTGDAHMSTDTPDIGRISSEIGQLSVPIAEDSAVPYRVTSRCDPVTIRPRDLNMTYTLWIVDEYGNVQSRSCIGAVHLLKTFWMELNAMMQQDQGTDYCEALLHEDSDCDPVSAAFGICACIDDDDPRFSEWYERTKDAGPYQSLWKGVYVLIPDDIMTYMPDAGGVLRDAVGELLLRNVESFGGTSKDMSGAYVSHEQCALNADAVERSRFDDLTIRWNAIKNGGWTRQLMCNSPSLWRM